VIIVVEGVDGAGKSALVEALSDRLGIAMFQHSDNPIDGSFDSRTMAVHNRAAIEAALSIGADVLFDRSFPSEYVYGYGMRSGHFDSFMVQHLDHEVAASGGLGILMRVDDPWDVWGRSRDHHVADIDVMERLIKLYDDYMKHSAMDWLVIDATQPIEECVESAMWHFASTRPSQESVFMELAKQVSRRSTCLSRRVGAVLVSEEGNVLATGYNGAARTCGHAQQCSRLRKGLDSGDELDACDDVHAEVNAVLQAGKHGAAVKGAVLYSTHSPCKACTLMLVNAGVARVVYDRVYDERALKAAVPMPIEMEEM
jgi:dCMP deaminase